MVHIRRAIWEMWTPDIVVTTLEAVALSMDIDPECLRYHWEDFLDQSFEFNKRHHVASRSIETLEVSLAKFAAMALSWGWKIPLQMTAMAANLSADAKSVATGIKKSQNQSEAAIERHSKLRERTLAAVLATIATADRKDYTNKSDQKIVVTKLAGLVEDTRANYEKDAPGGKILSLQGIEDLIRNILNGKYFS